MAARRLLIVMVLLLAISTLAAALVPPPERRPGETGSTTQAENEPPAKASSGEGRLVEVEVRTQGQGSPRSVHVAPGDQLALTVSTSSPREVTVPAFGLVEFAQPGDPARLDLLIERAGTFEIRQAGTGVVARIVSERKRSN
jgi:hypothetical protein